MTEDEHREYTRRISDDLRRIRVATPGANYSRPFFRLLFILIAIAAIYNGFAALWKWLGL